MGELPKNESSDAIRVAKITAWSAIGVAVITGVFLWVTSKNKDVPPPDPKPTPTSESSRPPDHEANPTAAPVIPKPAPEPPAPNLNDLTFDHSACDRIKGQWAEAEGEIPGNGEITAVTVHGPGGTSIAYGGAAITYREGLDPGYLYNCMMNPPQPPTGGANSLMRRCERDAQDMSVERCSTAGASLSCWYANAVGARPKKVKLSGCFR